MDLSPESADRAQARAAELLDCDLDTAEGKAAFLAAIESLSESEAKELAVAALTSLRVLVKRSAAAPLN